MNGCVDMKIYMKSGNVIKLRGIKDWKIKYDNAQITYFWIELEWWATLLGFDKLVMGSIDLAQIEAIVV